MAVELADLLDELIGDAEATRAYADYVLTYAQSGIVLELACGTGALAEQLASVFTVEGLDVDPAMIRRFRARNPRCATYVRSMIDLSGLGYYDVILCFGDSLNYLTDDDDVQRVFQAVWDHLKPGGVFLMDAHTEARLAEFETEFIEEGILGTTAYQWTIQTLADDRLDHHLVFYDPAGAPQHLQIVQRVYSLDALKRWLERFSWSIEVFSDFVEGIDPQAEKYFLACRKEKP
jgi:SAM-dependent methyltransferase